MTGRALDSSGKPIVGALVALVEDVGHSHNCYDENFDITDSLGRFYVVAELDHSRVVVKRSDESIWQERVENRRTVNVLWPATSTIEMSVDRKLTQGDKTLGFHSAQYWAGMSVLRRTIELDAKNSGRIEGVLPGEYYVLADHVVGGENVTHEIAKVVVEEGEDYRMQLGENGRRIAGKLSQKPSTIRVVRQKMRYEDVSNPVELIECGADGSFQSRPLGPGDYLLHIANVPFSVPVSISDQKGAVITDESLGSPVQKMIWHTFDMRQQGRWSIEDTKIARLLAHADKKDVTTELLRIVEDDGSPYPWRETALTTLGKMTDREGVLDTMLGMLNADAPSRRKCVKIIRAFQNSKDGAERIIAAVSEFREDSDPRDRWGSYYTMCKLAEIDAERRQQAVPFLVEMLNDPWCRIRADVAAALGGFAAKEALPVLAIAKKDRIGQVRVWAAWAAWKVDGDDASAIALMTSHLYSTSYSGKWEAAYLLDHFESLPPLTVNALLEASKYEVKPPYVGVVYEWNRIKRSALSTLKKRAPEALE